VKTNLAKNKWVILKTYIPFGLRGNSAVSTEWCPYGENQYKNIINTKKTIPWICLEITIAHHVEDAKCKIFNENELPEIFRKVNYINSRKVILDINIKKYSINLHKKISKGIYSLKEIKQQPALYEYLFPAIWNNVTVGIEKPERKLSLDAVWGSIYDIAALAEKRATMEKGSFLLEIGIIANWYSKMISNINNNDIKKSIRDFNEIKEMWENNQRSCLEVLLVKLYNSVADTFIRNGKLIRCAYCHKIMLTKQGKKYCSLISEGRNCKKKAENDRYYLENREILKAKSKREMNITRKYYKEKGIKKINS